MKTKTTIKLQMLFVIFGLSLGACTKKETTVVPSDVTNLSNLYSYAIRIGAASLESCPAGGQTYSVFIDTNRNRMIDESEEIVSSDSICNGSNGSNGANGYSTVFAMDRVETDSCASGTGVQVNAGLDTNRSSALDNSEITQSQMLCDGANGTNGNNGINGKSFVFEIAEPSANICPAGGSIIVMALDENDNNELDGQDSNQQSLTLCNGQNGTNGADGVNGSNAVLPAYTPVAPIFPCGNTSNFEEVLLRLQNGHILASLSDNTNGKMTRLALIPDGSYMTTDNTNCQFSLSTSNKTRSVSWSNQVQQSWQISY